MAYIGIQPAEKFTSFATQEFSTSATTSYTLDHAVANENEIALFVNNVRQQPGSGKAYTATGTALTLSAATASTDTMYCIFLGRALQTVTPATNSITAAMVGNDLISGKTALAATPASTDELLISDAGTLKRIDASFFQNTPAFYAELSSAQTTTDGSATKVNFNTEVFDSGSVYDNSTNYRFTPTVAGKYFIYSTCQLRSDTSNTIDGCFLHIYKNGSYVTKAAEENQASRHFGNCLTTNTIVDMNGSSDYVEVYGYIDVSSGQPSQPADNRCIFGGYRITG